ncbi:DUF4917 family protein [Sinorhizobium meliloti]|nr:DUF4917 family protein [Sinorhizobium meliloti]
MTTLVLLAFDEALAAAGNPKKKHLMLGNGFSISLRPDIFTYGSLLESADFSKAPNARTLFDQLGTQDFELVIKHLIDAAAVARVYLPGSVDLIRALEHDAAVVKDALVTAVARRHPDRPYDITTAQYRACREFLNRFDHIYTLNYDVLLYWALMHTDVDMLGLTSDDGFRHPDDARQPYVSWLQSQSATIHYLHGALHLFDSGPEIIKYTWSKTDIPIVDQIRAALDEGNYPLFVAEGTSSSKLEKIMHNAYLHKALRSLESCANQTASAFVIFGHSLAANDEHILRAFARGRVGTLLVSIYGDPKSALNQEIMGNALWLRKQREEINPKNPLNVIFFEASSAHVWE